MSQFIKSLLPLLTIFADIILVGSVLLWLLSKVNAGIKRFFDKNVLAFFSENALLLSFFVAATSTLGSLFYSEILHYNPCKLCWFERIVMYPQSILLLVAFIRKDVKMISYTIYLSVIGAVIALYHYLLQFKVVTEVTPCSVVGYSQSCSDHFLLQYGYITIPMMALSAFLLLIGAYIAIRVHAKKQA